MCGSRVCALVAAMVTLGAVSLEAQRAEPFDLLIRGGRVLDGTGNPAYPADVGVRGGHIVAVGPLGDAAARRVIDASGRLVTPGFIDIHSHADDASGDDGLRSGDVQRRAAPNLVSQGITTVVVNQDGRSPWPIAAQRAAIAGAGIGPNAILLAGHGTIRRLAMGTDFRRPATPREIARMQELLRQALAEGAWGMSAGLEYVPGRWSTTDELVALVEELVPRNGVYISHQRSEGGDPLWYVPSRDPAGAPTVFDALRETIELGERTGARVVASHIKTKGVDWWGVSHAMVRLIDEARARGVDVWADQYPYTTTGSDGNTVLIPRWALEGEGGAGDEGDDTRRADWRAALRAVLADTALARRVRGDIAHEIRRRGGPDNIVVFEYPDSSVMGKSLGELAAARGITPVEVAIALQLEGSAERRGGGRLRGFSLWEGDLDVFAGRPWTATSSDAGIALPDDGSVHARFYGAFPRKLRHFALDRHVLPLADAVRASTSLPAQILGLQDRGLIREGFHADLVVLDPVRLRDRATFVAPHQYSEGVEHVLVNGTFVVDGGRLTAALPGAVLVR